MNALTKSLFKSVASYFARSIRTLLAFKQVVGSWQDNTLISVCLAHESEIADTPRAKQETGDMIVGIASKTDRADLP